MVSGFGVSWSLLGAAVVTAVVGSIVLRRWLPLSWATGIAVLKVLIPFAYFSWLYDGTWTFLDDIGYLEQGRRLLDLGYNPVEALVDPSAWAVLFSMTGGRHVIYGWWNLLGQYLFGEFYYAPIFLNIIIIFAAALVFVKLVRAIGFGQTYAQAAGIFFLFHWEIVVWSSLTNLKDPIVLFLTIVGLLAVIRIREGDREWVWVVILGTVLFLFTWIRFYVPLVIGGSVMFWSMVNGREGRQFVPGVLMVVAVILIVTSIDMPLHRIQPSNVLQGGIRYLLTPLPWKVVEQYSFLMVPAALHLAMALPAIVGGGLLWWESRNGRLLLIYLMVVTCLYGMVPEAIGPRQRFQVTFVIGLSQFHFLYRLIVPTLRVMGERAIFVECGNGRLQGPETLVRGRSGHGSRSV